MNILFKGGLVIIGDSGTYTPLRKDVLVKGNRIASVADQIIPGPSDNTRVVDLSGKMLMPGLINAHSHSYANMVKGMGEGLPLEPWMYYAMLVGKMTPDQLRIGASLQVIENIRNGCTAFIDHIAQDYAGMDVIMDMYSKTGIRATLAPMIGDLGYIETLPPLKEESGEIPGKAISRDPGEIIAECEELVKKWHRHEDRLSIMVGPSGPQRCSDDLLIKSYELAQKYNLGFHTHLLETKIQAQTALSFWGRSMVEHLAKLGILTPRASLAHAVWLTEKEIEVVAQYGASVIHNPMSNLTLGSGLAPLTRLLKSGINVALGSDGSNCGGSQSIIQSMRLAAVLPRIFDPNYHNWPTAGVVFGMATSGGSRVLGLGSDIGSISAGKIADLVVVDLAHTVYQPLQDPVSQFVSGESGMGIELVMVMGKILMEDGHLTTIDENAVLAEAADMAPGLDKMKNDWLEANKINFKYVESVYREQWGF